MRTPLLRVMMTCSLALLFVGSACPNPSNTDGGVITAPPQVFITVQSSTVIGTAITGTTTVSGCKTVSGVEIDADDGSFLVNANYAGNPTTWSIAPDLLNRFYQKKGIALTLSLVAKAICAEDNRTNTSQSVTVVFFPASKVVSSPGVQMLPDSFVAEGGVGGTATTFIGCIGTTQGTVLARVDATGTVIATHEGLPFSCSYNSTISERSTVNFTRWLVEPSVGAFAFDKDLNITNTVKGPVTQFAVAKDSSIILWEQDEGGTDRLLRADTVPLSSTQSYTWSVEFPGWMNSNPVIDTGNGWVYTSSWQYKSGVANIVMLKYSYADGSILNAVGGFVPTLITQNYGTDNPPLTPPPMGTFSVDGTLLYMPLIAFDSNQVITTSVLACATGAGGCQGASRRWSSPAFPSIVTTALPFSNGNFIAAASDLAVYFLSITDGSIQNLAGTPLRPTGSLRTKALQPGRGADFYIFNGPLNQNYPSEIVATDSPMNGELWRLSVGSGQSPVTGMFMAVDDSGQAWLRVGRDMVKALKNADYRTARGATLP